MRRASAKREPYVLGFPRKKNRDAYFLTRNPNISGKQPSSAFPNHIRYSLSFEDKKASFWGGTNSIVLGWSMHYMKHKYNVRTDKEGCGSRFVEEVEEELPTLLPGRHRETRCAPTIVMPRAGRLLQRYGLQRSPRRATGYSVMFVD